MAWVVEALTGPPFFKFLDSDAAYLSAFSQQLERSALQLFRFRVVLTLRHTRYNRRPLHDSFQEFLKHLHRLWGFTVRLEAVDENGKVELVGECPQSKGR